MLPRCMRGIFLVAASALAYVLHTVFFCKHRKTPGRPVKLGRARQYQVNSDAAANDEALLRPDSTEPSQVADNSTDGSNQPAVANIGEPGQPDASSPTLSPSTHTGKPVTGQLSQDQSDSGSHNEEHAILLQPEVERSSQEQAPGGLHLDPGSQPDPYLQNLIDVQLGPPKFAVAKPPLSNALHTQEAIHPAPSLEALLDQQFGPPKFAVPKASGAGVPQQVLALPVQQLGSDKQQPGPPADQHHLRLEVLTGPAAGVVYDTVDQTQEVSIGRVAECALSLGADPEVSSKHAIIRFSSSDQYWKLTDVGSLNGSSLNGAQLSTNRQTSPATPLATGDMIVFGSVTRVQVTCSPSHPRTLRTRKSDPGAAAADSTAAQPAAGAVPHFATHQPRPAAPHVVHTADPAARPVMSSVPPQMLSLVGPPLTVQHHEQLGISLAIQQRVGADHKRTNTGCEDVAFWQLPWQPHSDSSTEAGGALLALFDGHQGVQAAEAAKKLLPQVLTEHLKAETAASGEGGGLLLCRSSAAQAALLQRLFLDMDARLTLDEGCTATVLLLQRDSQGACALQTANVGDSSAVLVQLPASCLAAVHPAPPAAPLLQTCATQPRQSSSISPRLGTGAWLPATQSLTRDGGVLSSQHVDWHRRTTLDAPHTAAGSGHTLNDDISNGSAAGPAGGQHVQGGAQSAAPLLVEQSSEAGQGGPSAAEHLVLVPQQTQLHVSSSQDAGNDVAGGGGGGAGLCSQGEGEVVMTGREALEGGLLEGGGHWFKLTEDHRISSSVKERDRLALLGHTTVRTRLYGLNISRMLGDRYLKDEALGFIADPHVSPILRVPAPGITQTWDPNSSDQQAAAHQQPGQQNEGRDEASPFASAATHDTATHTGGYSEPAGRTLLVLASDGLWDVVSEGRAAALIAKTCAQDSGTSVAELATLLLSQAVNHRSKDDITVMVLELHPLIPACATG